MVKGRYLVKQEWTSADGGHSLTVESFHLWMLGHFQCETFEGNAQRGGQDCELVKPLTGVALGHGCSALTTGYFLGIWPQPCQIV